MECKNDKMKTETQIAKENVEELKKSGLKEVGWLNIDKVRCLTQLQSCKRFLEKEEKTEKFLQKLKVELDNEDCLDFRDDVGVFKRNNIDEKIQDLKNAIKHYKENGIE